MKTRFLALLVLLALVQHLSAQLMPLSVIVYKKDTAFTCITTDNAGNVYAGTNGKGLCKFDQKKWKGWNGFGTAFIKSNLRQIAVSGSNIWVASSGYVFFLGSGEAGNDNNFWGGIHKLDKLSPVIRTYYKGRPVLGQTNPSASGPPTRNILGVYLDNTGAPWCAGSYQDSLTFPAFLNYNSRYHFVPGAVGRFNGSNFSFLTGADLPDPTGILIGVGNNYKDENYSIGKRRTCRSITQVGNEMWVGSDGYEKDAATVITAGILRYSLDGTYLGKFDQNNTPSVPFGLTNGDFGPWALYQDVKGRVWAGMNGAKGIAMMDSSGWHYIGVPSVLPASTIFRPNSITGNAKGEVFFGTGGGLLVFNGSGSYAAASSYTVYTTTQGLSSNSIFGVAVDKNQNIWVATTAGVNKIERGDLFVYNRKPNAIIFTNSDVFRTPIIRYYSQTPQQTIDKDTLLISADGGKGAIFKWEGSSGDKVIFRIAEDPAGTNPNEFGSFTVYHQSLDSVRVLFNHPKFVDPIYTVTNDGGRTVRLEVVDPTVTPASVKISIPVRFVLPPVLMVHGVWAAVGSFAKMEKYLSNSYRNYKSFSLLRIWYDDIKHAEPVASQAEYGYIIPTGIDKLVENCALNKMAVGKVDILGHSRGGIFSRIYLQEKYVRYRSDINKLITVNTPHSGSQQANMVLDKRLVVMTVRKKITSPPLPPVYVTSTVKVPLGQLMFFVAKDPPDDLNGAIELKVNAPAILNDLNGPGNLNRNTTFSHAVTGKHHFEPGQNAMVTGLLQGAGALGIRLPAGVVSNGPMPWDDFFTSVFNTPDNDAVVPFSSQTGGLNTANISTFPGLNVAHSTRIGALHTTGVLDMPEPQFRIAELLRAKPTAGLFATDGFHPADLSSQYTLYMPNPSWLEGSAERVQDTSLPNFSLAIDTALDQKIFRPGDTVAVKISKINTDTVVIAYMGGSMDVYSDLHFGNDSIFRFPIPKEAIGAISIQAYGFRNHAIAYDSATIFVGMRSGVILDSIKITKFDSSGIVTVIQGDSSYFQLDGYFSDSTVRNITSLQPLAFAIAGGNISTLLPNKIKGVTVGFDQLKVSYGGKSDSINVEVVPKEAYEASTPLPLKFIGISAVYTGDRISVNWSTAAEVNNNRFEIEYSTTGANFIKVGTQPAGTDISGSSYHFDHFGFITGKNYYRIKQVDHDGKSSYSAVASVLVSSKNNIRMYPNPVEGKLMISFANQKNLKACRIFNANGQVVIKQAINGNSLLEIAVSQLPAGVYSLELTGADNQKVYSGKFVKK